jgi:hypothetical protein
MQQWEQDSERRQTKERKKHNTENYSNEQSPNSGGEPIREG